MFLYRLVLLVFFTPSLLLAGADLRTTVRDVLINSNSQQAGSIEVVLNSEVFQGASAEMPIYIRFTFDKGAVLCRTLVWTSLDNADEHTRSPIYLPVSFESREPGVTIDPATSDAISVVRWKAGESSIWLKVVRTANEIVVGASVNDDNRLRFGLGFSARSYWDQNNQRFQSGESNLPSTVRDPSDPFTVTETDSVSTLLCMDYFNSTLEASPFNPATQTIANFNAISFNEDTQGVDGPDAVEDRALIVNGAIRQPSFSFDNPIAKGRSSECEGNLTGNGTVIGSTPRCGEGLVSFLSTREVALFCSRGWGFGSDSLAMLTLNDFKSDFGFRVQTDGNGMPILDEDGYPLLFTEDFVFGPSKEAPSLAFTTSNNLFQATGDHLLSRRAILVYDGPGTSGGITLEVQSTVFQDASAANAAVTASLQIYSSDLGADDGRDSPPFDDPLEQPRRCPKSFDEILVDQELELGQFTDCQEGAQP
jgi:hypothetical protein